MSSSVFKRSLLYAITFLLLASPLAEGRRRTTSSSRSRTKKERTIETVRKEKEANARELQSAGRNLTENTRQTQMQLDSLESIRRQTTDIRDEIERLSFKIDSARTHITTLSDSIRRLENTAERLRAVYRASMRRTQGDRMASSKVAFIFSSASFHQAIQRMRYLREFGSWQERRAREIKVITAELAERRNELERLEATQQARIVRLDDTRADLERQQVKAQKLVKELKKNGASLQQILRAKEQRARELDRELDRLIAAEQERIEKERQERLRKERERQQRERKERERKERERQERERRNGGQSRPASPQPQTPPATDNTQLIEAEADRKLTGSFADNRGRLLFPVSGSYRIVRGFGSQRHPDMPHVTTENNGIDIETSRGAKARAVFAGRVASILQVQGYNYIVMVRHGDYLTVYSGLDKPIVHNGEEVKSGQILAPMTPDPERDGRGLLHFEIRLNSNKCNPTEWVR